MNDKNTVTVTSEIRIKRCYGCGQILQYSNPKEPGYIPKDKYEQDDECLCERCYKLRHYSQYTSNGDVSIDYLTILNNAKREGALIVYVLNAFALESSILSGFTFSEADNCIAVINKRDTLGKNVTDEYLIAKAKRLLKEKGIFVKNIITASSTLVNQDVDRLFEEICKESKGRNVYFIGASQTGKSSLINSFMKRYINNTQKLLTTSPFPGTTLDVIMIPLDDKTYIYDIPGTISQSSIYYYVPRDKVRVIMPRTTIKPESFQAKENQSFIFSNLARVDFTSGDKTNFTFLKSNDLTISRCKADKAESLLLDFCKSDKTPIKSTMLKDLSAYTRTDLSAINNCQNKLIISGLCEISFVGKNQQFSVYAPKNVAVILEKAEESI